jgi:nitric oxide reductase NorD protein
MDLSLSTDGYTGGQRVLDVEKQAVILFAELLSEFGDRFEIAGFSSRTRHHCDYTTLKDFQEPWLRAAGRVGAAEPTGYTRIGPALRHATARMRQERSSARWIILLSDGKPNDYDRYEGNYGLADVRQAVKEARRDGIQIYGLAIEAVARHYLPLMLGSGAYRILPRPEQLSEALADFYKRLIRV